MEQIVSNSMTYRVRLSSSRILGPLDLNRIKILILKNQITGVELVKKSDSGEWKSINQFPELAELLLAHAQGQLSKSEKNSVWQSSDVIQGEPFNLLQQPLVLPGVTEILSVDQPSSDLKDQQEDLNFNSNVKTLENKISNGEASLEDKTQTVKVDLDHTKAIDRSVPVEKEVYVKPLVSKISQENTVLFQDVRSNKNLKNNKNLKKILLLVLFCFLSYSFLFEEKIQKIPLKSPPIRPQIPEYFKGRFDSKKSHEIYLLSLKDYLLDNVDGYRQSSQKLKLAVGYDPDNVQALALLASSYINLIDSSNKDENYFSVLSRLIELSRAKNVDLPEIVIADVEFFLIVNQYEAAQRRIVEYTNLHKNYGIEMLYYLALIAFYREDFKSASNYLSHFVDRQVFSPKIFFLKGLIAERLNDLDTAIVEYKKAIQLSPSHAKSYLRIAVILRNQGKMKEMSPYLDILLKDPHRLTPLDLGLAYYLHGQLSELYGKWSFALSDLERAVKLDPENHDYLLELYTLRAKEGESLANAQKQARMYYFLGEGEKLIKQGQYEKALVPLLQARQSQDESPLPLVKIGDMFSYLNQVQNSKMNYELAAKRAPNDVMIWSKYIDSLIKSYEWEEAQKAMNKFRAMKVSQSAIDKLAADMYQRQGKIVEAAVFYKKAMARDIIDSSVYIAYAKNLMLMKNYKDAPFFFALAMRFDPLNLEAMVGTAKCISETDSLSRAVQMLKEESQKGADARSEYLAAIAELYIKKGQFGEAQNYIDQSMRANLDYALTWKLQAEVFLNQESFEKNALEKALIAYQSYSERNSSDPIGYLERYKIFIKKSNFEKAKEELNKIYEIYPKYPNLHYYLGTLYNIQGNYQVAADEFKQELKNNPDNFQNLLGLGKALIEVQKPQEALNYFSRAMQINPNSSEAKQQAGWSHFLLKNYVASISLIRSAIALNSGNPVLFRRLALIYRDMGDQNQSCEAVKKYLQMEPDATDKVEFSYCF